MAEGTAGFLRFKMGWKRPKDPGRNHNSRMSAFPCKNEGRDFCLFCKLPYPQCLEWCLEREDSQKLSVERMDEKRNIHCTFG